jgi:hypothetical protein
MRLAKCRPDQRLETQSCQPCARRYRFWYGPGGRCTSIPRGRKYLRRASASRRRSLRNDGVECAANPGCRPSSAGNVTRSVATSDPRHLEKAEPKSTRSGTSRSQRRRRSRARRIDGCKSRHTDASRCTRIASSAFRRGEITSPARMLPGRDRRINFV